MDSVNHLYLSGNTNEDFFAGIEQVFDIDPCNLSEFLYTHIKEYPLENEPYLPLYSSELESI